MDSESHIPVEDHELLPIDHTQHSIEEVVSEEGSNRISSPFPHAAKETVISGKETQKMGSLQNKTQLMGIVNALITPIVAIGYLAFCCTVITRTVPVNLGPLVDTSPQNLSTIKSGVTTVTIIIVLIALWPLISLEGDIISEEFFRTLRQHPNGVPLSSLNYISTPAFGKVAAVKAVWRGRTSRYYTVVVMTSFLVVATSSLAPSAYIHVVPIDGPLQAFAVGSIGPSSIFNTSTAIIGVHTQNQFSDNTPQSSGIAWAETLAGMNYSFSQPTSAIDSQSYIVPVPKSLLPSTFTRYLSDVAVLNPSCSFQRSNITGVVTLNSSSPQYFVYVGLSGGLTVSVASDDFTQNTTGNMTLTMQTYLDFVGGGGVSNSASGSLPTDGSVIWRLDQCSSGCTPNSFDTPIRYNLDGLPKVQFSANGSMTWDVSYLVCTPGTTIETREVRSIGNAQLIVVSPPSSGPGYTRQKNLDLRQMNLLLSGVFIGTDGRTEGRGAGPQFTPTSFDLGSKLQASLLFGVDTVNEFNRTGTSPPPARTSGSVVLTPLPVRNITQAYVRIMSSAVKFYMNAGAIGTTYVPGREARNVLIFRSSKEYIAASSALFAILSVLVVGAQWRGGKTETYNFVGVAAAMESSDIQENVMRVKVEMEVDEEVATSDDDVIRRLADKMVVLRETTDGKGLQLR